MSTIDSTGMASRPLLDGPASITVSPPAVAWVCPPESIVWIREAPVAIWCLIGIGANVAQMACRMPTIR